VTASAAGLGSFLLYGVNDHRAMAQPFSFTYGRAEVPVGIGAGNYFYFPLEQAALPPYIPQLDFTTITSVYFAVTRQRDTTTAKWTATILSDVTQTGLLALYPFSPVGPGVPGDCYIDGVYFVRPWAIDTLGRNIPFRPGRLYVMTP
jgi:hypothetical protein